MRRTVAALVAVLTLAGSPQALAWDPFAAETDGDPAPPATDPAPFIVPDGLYVVTDVYAGDVVSSNGLTTTYTTATTHEAPGTWARVVDVVGTGQSSAYDGLSLNGRARLGDGRLVAGSYYEDFLSTADGFVSVNVVFFQDDSVTVAPPTPSQPPTPTPTRGPVDVPPVAPSPGPTTRPGATVPPAASSAPPPAPIATPAPRIATAGIALGETAPALASIEVLRGRRVALWPRVFLDGVSVSVRTWRLVSGSADVIGPTSGTGGVPCDATWLTLVPPGSAWTLRFEVTSDALPGRVLVATVDVVVRSPALEW